jgi:hypothetical protein
LEIGYLGLDIGNFLKCRIGRNVQYPTPKLKPWKLDIECWLLEIKIKK